MQIGKCLEPSQERKAPFRKSVKIRIADLCGWLPFFQETSLKRPEPSLQRRGIAVMSSPAGYFPAPGSVTVTCVHSPGVLSNLVSPP